MRTYSLIAALALFVMALASPLPAQGFSAGLHFGGPVRAALAVGVIWMRPTDGDHGQGPILLAEPGLGGDRVSAGYLFARGNLGQFASVRATGLVLNRDGGRRYAGIDLQVQPLFAIAAGSAPSSHYSPLTRDDCSGLPTSVSASDAVMNRSGVRCPRRLTSASRSLP